MAELLHTALPGLPPPQVGKVREVYDLGSEMLIVATDRISAFDAVMANGIPDKGAILNQMSAFWFGKLASICPNHMISIEESDIDARLPQPHPELYGRSLIARKAKPLPVECVARGYLTGSLYKEYVAAGGSDNPVTLHGLELPGGLLDGSALPEPIFSPATKAEVGHDENISFEHAVNAIGAENAAEVRDWTLALYKSAADYAHGVDIIIADTKFEFGETEDGLILIDEALTPDSSRFWSREGWRAGGPQPSFDKQYVRDFLEGIHWDKRPPGPVLPEVVVEGTRERYREAFLRLTGRPFAGQG